MARDAARDVPSGGKQIVFFFMAATFVAVVVFLCGVLVGRGVPRGGVVSSSPIGEHFSTGDLPPATLTTPSSEPSAGAAASHDLSYPQRLTGRGPAAELVTASQDVATSPSEPTHDVLDVLNDGAGQADTSAYAVQVVNSRGAAAAQAVASELRSGGWPVYVLDPDPEEPVALYRVRVGPFPSRGDAEQALARLVGDDWMPGAYVTR